jgi:hypothetical protein
MKNEITISTKWWIVILLSILAILALAVYSVVIITSIKAEESSFFDQDQDSPAPDHNAKAEVAKYRRFKLQRGEGVFYSKKGLQGYIDKFDDIIKLTDATPGVPHIVNGDTLKWEIGFYWKMKTDLTTGKKHIMHDYCFIPTLVDDKGVYQKHPKVFDYFDDEYKLYNHTHDNDKYQSYELLGATNTYDNGGLWP